MREILHTLLDYPQFEPFYYWSPPSDMPPDQTEPELISAVADRAEVQFHSVGIYLAPDSIPVETLEIAVDDETGEACGIVSMRGMTSAATWTKPGASRGCPQRSSSTIANVPVAAFGEVSVTSWINGHDS